MSAVTWRPCRPCNGNGIVGSDSDHWNKCEPCRGEGWYFVGEGAAREIAQQLFQDGPQGYSWYRSEDLNRICEQATLLALPKGVTR